MLAALGYAFSKETAPIARAVLFGFVILISVVFRILDIRTTGFVNLCQRVGRTLAAGNGLYAEIDKNRFADRDKDSLFEKCLRRVTLYGFAINLLVAGVIGPSAVGLVICLLEWNDTDYGVCWSWSVIAAVVVAILVLFVSEVCTHTIWKAEKKGYTNPPKTTTRTPNGAGERAGSPLTHNP